MNNYNTMYNPMNSMGMPNSNSMINFTYLNNFNSSYGQNQPGYNNYNTMGTPQNKFASNSQFYGSNAIPQQQQNQIGFNNMYQNKVPNQMQMNPINPNAATIPGSTPMNVNPQPQNLMQNTSINMSKYFN